MLQVWVALLLVWLDCLGFTWFNGCGFGGFGVVVVLGFARCLGLGVSCGVGII